MLCSRVQNLLSAYCDRELTGAEMLGIRRHLDVCPACEREHRALLHVKRLFAALPGVGPRQPFRVAILDSSGRLQPAWMRAAARLLSPARALLADWGGSLYQPVTLGNLSPGRVSLGVAVGLSVLCAVMLRQPQHSDAISAHVLEAMVREDAEPVVESPRLQPTYYPTFTSLRSAGPPPYYRPQGSPLLPVTFTSMGPGVSGR